ncbi:MAG: S-methyl-5-thioribose-1-phosphate isomerase [Syntrophomonadaceae bacterium]
MIRTIYYEAPNVYILDQNQLPGRLEYEAISDHTSMAHAITSLKVRGAPLIGVSAAFGLALAVRNFSDSKATLEAYYSQAELVLSRTRPTAVNLFWAIARMRKIFDSFKHDDLSLLAEMMIGEAQEMCAEDVAVNKRIGKHGQELLPARARILTHCNAGALATCGYGTALGVVRALQEQHKLEQVWACETRPVLQGARLTVWELMQDKIPVTLITDSMAGHLMQNRSIDAVVVGADRVAANGDSANKIGTYSLAVLAAYHHIPFYIAAPLSTIDLNVAAGNEIPIEERDPEEVKQIAGKYVTLPEAKVYNPAFDVTPAGLITAIITEVGAVKAPYSQVLQEIGREKS